MIHMKKYDVIGDIHGCIEELQELVYKLGYILKDNELNHPDNRTLIFLGDLTDRGPASIKVIDFVFNLVVRNKTAAYVPGNHCNKLYRFFLGNNVQLKHGIETTVTEFDQLSPREQSRIRDRFMVLYKQAPLYLKLTDIQTIIAHAGIKKSFIGRYDKEVKTFVLYGDITGESDEAGRPVRKDWAKHYTGSDWIVYGHTPVLRPRQVNNTINIDTGCVFGNKLTAFRLPEKTTVSVPSQQAFIEDKFTVFE